MSQVKAETQFGEVQKELFLRVRSFKVFAGMCWQTINGHL